MCPKIFQPCIISCISSMWRTEELEVSLLQQISSQDGSRAMKILWELPRGGKMDSSGKRYLRVLQ